MESHESAPRDYQEDSSPFDYAELERMVAGNPPDDNDTNPMMGTVLAEVNLPDSDTEDAWKNYEGPFEADYAQNSYKEKDPKIFVQPGTDQYPDLSASEGAWVKKSDLYRTEDSTNEKPDS